MPKKNDLFKMRAGEVYPVGMALLPVPKDQLAVSAQWLPKCANATANQ